MRTRHLAAQIGLWTLQILLGVVFVLLGAGKFGDPTWARRFAAWGYPPGFYMVIGALEALGGLAVLIPAAASYGAALLGAIMIGAAATHLLHGEFPRIPPPLVYLALLTVVGLLRRDRAYRWRPGAVARREPERV